MKKIAQVLAAVFFLSVLTGSVSAAQSSKSGKCPAVKKCSTVQTSKSISRIFKYAKVGQDKRFKEMLEAGMHYERIVAPASFRSLFGQLPVSMFGMGMGYVHENGRDSLVWRTNEITLKGKKDDIEGMISDIMKSNNFRLVSEVSQNSEICLYYQHFENGIKQEALIKKLKPFSESDPETLRSEILWRAENSLRSPRLTLSAILEAIPELRNGWIDLEIYETLSGFYVDSLTFSGSWIKNYMWDAVFTGTQKENLPKILSDLIAKQGFTLRKVDGDTTTYGRESTGSFIYLSQPDSAGKTRFKIQPQS